MRPPRALVAAVAVLALSVTGCAGSDAVDATAGTGTRNGLDQGSIRLVPASQRSVVTGLSGPTLDGGEFSLADHRGQVVVVNFWGSWCPPCTAEADGLGAVADDYRGKGVQFVGVDIKEYGKAAPEKFVRDHHIDYPSIWDPEVTQALRFGAQAPATTPTTYVLDRSGRVAARISGEVTYTQLKQVVGRVLAEAA